MELKPEDRALGQEIDREHAAELKQEERIIEALLFAMGRAVSLPEMAAALDADEVLAKAAAERLLQEYEARRGGMLIRRVEAAYQLCTNPVCYDALIRVVSHPKKPVLSDVVLETLAIIAYKQPVTKAEIERIRGVQSDHAVNRLVEYGLVEESGRLNAPGRPALFVTTEEFLRRFGMESLKELPALSEDMAAEIEAQVAEEVSDVLGTDPETLQEEMKNQRPAELTAAANEAEENAVEPEFTVAAERENDAKSTTARKVSDADHAVKPFARKKRETAAVRAAVEAEQREEQEEAAAPTSFVAAVTAVTAIGTAAASAAAELVAPDTKTEPKSKTEAFVPTSEVMISENAATAPMSVTLMMDSEAAKETTDKAATEKTEAPEPVKDDEDEKAPEVNAEDDEVLEQMIYEAAVGTEPVAEQHYSFLEDEEAESPEGEDEKEEASEADLRSAAEDSAEEAELTTAPEDDETSEGGSQPEIAAEPENETDAAGAAIELDDIKNSDTVQEDAETTSDDAELDETDFLSASSRSMSGSGRHHSIFDSVQVLSDAELEEIEEEERRFRESLKGLPPRKPKQEIFVSAESEKEIISATTDLAFIAAKNTETEYTEAAEPENTESENTEAANAGSPEN